MGPPNPTQPRILSWRGAQAMCPDLHYTTHFPFWVSWAVPSLLSAVPEVIALHLLVELCLVFIPPLCVFLHRCCKEAPAMVISQTIFFFPTDIPCVCAHSHGALFLAFCFLIILKPVLFISFLTYFVPTFLDGHTLIESFLCYKRQGWALEAAESQKLSLPMAIKYLWYRSWISWRIWSMCNTSFIFDLHSQGFSASTQQRTSIFLIFSSYLKQHEDFLRYEVPPRHQF